MTPLYGRAEIGKRTIARSLADNDVSALLIHILNSMQRTPLFDWHIAQQARMVEFGGWEMPVQYSSVIQEHAATRNAVGITDVSHMGRLIFEGSGAGVFLNSVLSRNIAVIKPGQIRYSLLTNDNGGIVDDLLVGLLPREDDEPYYLVVVNASNREKDLAVFRQFLPSANDVTMKDLTMDWAMIAVQGPKAIELLQPFLYTDLSAIKYYNGLETTFRSGSRWGLITRTGYTGEDGFELCVDSYFAEQITQELLKAGEPIGAVPVGLGARDTLRLEAALPLYGHEMNDDINPFEAGLSYALHLDGPDFPGRDVLRRMKDEPLRKIRIGLELSEKRPAREGCEIFADNEKIGWITSGTFAPALQKPIAMGYVPPEFARIGQTLSVDIRGKRSPATVVPLPFYKR